VEKNKKTSRESLFANWSFKKINYIVFITGLLLVIFGYILMGTGEVNSFQSLTLAPMMLFIGYLVVIPLSILIKK
tara:strand:- start:1386 stop:1610 length:225 start_codon:yes stop_codon:yes gene_type:complete